MSESLVDQIARAVLYEGYILYPYRPATKNTQRWTFGGIFPIAYTAANPTDPSVMQSECLIASTPQTKIALSLRFLHLTNRTVEAAPDFSPVESLRVAGAEYRSWQEAVERAVLRPDIHIASLLDGPMHHDFSFPQSRTTEALLENEQLRGHVIRDQQPIAGLIELSATGISTNVCRLTIRVTNQSPIAGSATRDEAQRRAFASTHLILSAQSGAFISLTDPPAPFAAAAAQCQNRGCWPILIGEPHQTDTLLISPIILPDYPQIAPESPGDLFDSGEIDEILTLRIMTLTHDEKAQAAATDPRVKQMLERTESLARSQLANLHGSLRHLTPVHKGAANV